ncbi:Hsp70 family protein [Rhodococcus sp. ARC_M6]|uniref:Hsp70 family protein n=1 Tax=Rhodococcus sp. ARC_M6 TaxID=2928852 RepID=UPI001FB1DDCC|nr:Hsp70 family protein [Rhodococcus sp. ARC_M6]MCJ0907115.1 Hsp70 family protein [Rhodococcus sp. ARC_M6]
MNQPHPTPISAPPGSPAWVLAVDFGTSNTAAAHTGIRSGAPETLPLTHEGNLMGSAVFVESPASIDVGDVAVNRAQTNPAAFISSPKRVIGQGMVHVNGYDLPTWVPVAAVLRFVLERATAVHRGLPPVRLVLTHPEGWALREIQVLHGAAAQLGFVGDGVATVSEPRAAAHFYTRTERIQPGEVIAVFDFGGGTLDVAVLTATGIDTFEVISARGDNALGGKNIDALIRRWVDHQLADENPELLAFLRSDAPPHILRTLDDSIRRAKELLSSTDSATISVVDSRRDHRETLTLTRGEFESIIAPEIERAAVLTHAALVDAGVRGPQDLTALYLTGGSSRIPLVAQRIAALGPIATLDDPKTVVVQGALIAAARPAAPLPVAPPPAAGGSPTSISPPAVLFGASPRTGATPVITAPPRPGTPPPSQRPRRRGVLIAAGAVVVLAVVGGAVWFAGSSSTDNAAQSSTSGRSANTTPGTAQDIQAVQDRTTEYFAALNSHNRSKIDAMKCTGYIGVTTTPGEAPPSQNLTFTLKDFVSTTVIGDTGSVRVRMNTRDGDTSADSDGVVLMEFVREHGTWMFCAVTDQ